MQDLKQIIVSGGFRGELDDTPATIDAYSHDASLFEIKPKLVVFPVDAADVEKLVRIVNEHKQTMPDLSLTARSAGTDMAGGAINDSVIIDFRRHFTGIEEISLTEAHAQPGVLYRDFEQRTLQHGALMPTFPASRDLASIGGMVANNSGGEKSLEYGKTKDFVTELKVVFADGVERTVKPLTKTELDQVMQQKDFMGETYRALYELCERHYDIIKAAKPVVSKNSMGYTLWEVWDRKTGIFDLTKLIVGSEGTLGMVTDIHFRLVPARPHSGLLVLFLRDNLTQLGQKFNQIFWLDNQIVNERGSVLIFNLTAQQVKTLATHHPELFTLTLGCILLESVNLITCPMTFKLTVQCLYFIPDFLFRLAIELDHQYQLGDALH